MNVKIFEDENLISELSEEKEKLISDILKENKIPFSFPCNATGKCGKCKVKALGSLSPISDTEYKFLSYDEIKSNIRLGCMAKVEGDVSIFLEKAKKNKIVTNGELPSFNLSPIGQDFGFAVDIGTTTVAIYLCDEKEGKIIDKLSFMNPQGQFGADVISRISASLNGKSDDLTSIIKQSLNDGFKKLCDKNNLSYNSIDAIVITGNTTMLYLLKGVDVEPLSHSPFEIEDYLGDYLDLEFDNFKGVLTYLPRTIHAFVGSDITCAILSAKLFESEKPSVLVDIGTNGEMAIFSNGKSFCCATAAGPAFEGSQITCGMAAGEGAIDKVFLDKGKISFSTINDISPIGICGSGLIDTIAVLLKTGLIDETGYINEESEDFKDYVSENSDGDIEVKLCENIVITQADIRSLQLAKAAICAGILSLINAAGLETDDIEKLIIAGGFGSYIDCENAGVIGLIPNSLSNKAVSVGNASGMGAVMALLSKESIDESIKISKESTPIELSTSPFFMEKYVDCMTFE